MKHHEHMVLRTLAKASGPLTAAEVQSSILGAPLSGVQTVLRRHVGWGYAEVKHVSRQPYRYQISKGGEAILKGEKSYNEYLSKQMR